MSSTTAELPAAADRPAPPPAAPARPPGPAFAPLTGSQLLLGTVALSLATFMNVLDSSIANVSIPAISGDMGVSPNQGTWVITSFGVANAISVPLTGWLTQRFGQVRLFVASILLFVIASWLCGLAPNIESLIAFRVLQGLVAAAVTWGIYKKRETPVHKLPIDKTGLALLVLWVGSLQLMLDKGQEED
ncbi:MFS transporter, partial [Chitinimonas sp.]|uniref:MFS transporter n=1 Tax=Chitinimonas sp. TaxID=1934313 RepID=UPI002F95EDC1